MKRTSSKRVVATGERVETASTGSKENLKTASSEKTEKTPRPRPPRHTVNDTIASNDHEGFVKTTVARSNSSRIFGRNGTSRKGGCTSDEELGGVKKRSDGPSSRGVRRRHTSELVKVAEAAKAAGLGVGGIKGGVGGDAVPELREVVVNGKKKMVWVKKTTAAEAAAAEDGHRKLVKVKVVKQVKKSAQQPHQTNDAIKDAIPMKVGIPANHQLRNLSSPDAQAQSKFNNSQNACDNVSGVWSKAARSIFSFGNDKRSRASSGGGDELLDLAFQPEVLGAEVQQRPEGADDADEGDVGEHDNNNNDDQARDKTANNDKNTPSPTSDGKKFGYKPPTMLNGETGLATADGNNHNNINRAENPKGATISNTKKAVPSLTPRQPEFFARYVAMGAGGDNHDPNGPPMEIRTNTNMTRTKTKSVYLTESMIRRQFIQDQWLSGGSNYQVWEKAMANNLVDMSVVTAVTEATNDTSAKGGGEGGYGGGHNEAIDTDDVSEITYEDMVPDMLVEVAENKGKGEEEKQQEPDDAILEQWEALCTHRIQRYGPRSALTAEAFVNRGIAQLQANRLEEAADSLLSAVCFLEEVHGTIDHQDRNGNGGAPSHMHMAQAFFFLGQGLHAPRTIPHGRIRLL